MIRRARQVLKCLQMIMPTESYSGQQHDPPPSGRPTELYFYGDRTSAGAVGKRLDNDGGSITTA